MKPLAFGAALAATLALSAPALAAGPLTFVQAGRVLVDPASGKVETAKTLVVQDGKVVRVEDGYVAEPGATVVDLKSRFVLPGLIDSHVHLTSEQGPSSRMDEVTLSAADQAFAGARYAKRTLMAGFTTVADLGGENEAVFALRKATANGDVPGPRIIAAGSAISIHGGHGDVNGLREDIMHVLRPNSVCSGAEDCRRAVREQVWLGADVIKITATGGVLSNTAAGLAQQFSDDELAAIVDSAHRMGRRVTAHAHGVDGINAFLRAGGDSIEHGTYLDKESIALFKKNGAYLVPTLEAGDFVARIASGPNNFLTPAQTAKALEAGPKMLDMARRAHEAGVKIAFGTDTGVSAHGQNAYEFVLLVKAGLTPLEAVQAATVNAADHLQISAQAGSLTPGHNADLIAVDGDPLTDVSILQKVGFVMKSGVVYKN
ncbi:amidohydrolase family protein [Phenylobacterium sp.]|uniref:metal-dependent hydrolase family protein n=1 Tax=Phenylobacterium sp. TaxID=1871053 RepID=UPI0035B1AB4D